MLREKRKLLRADLWLAVLGEVTFKSMTIRGRVQNLGSGGLFMECPDPLPVATMVKVNIYFRSKQKKILCLRASGAVIWFDKKGMGIQFVGLDIDQYRKYVLSMIND